MGCIVLYKLSVTYNDACTTGYIITGTDHWCGEKVPYRVNVVELHMILSSWII